MPASSWRAYESVHVRVDAVWACSELRRLRNTCCLHLVPDVGPNTCSFRIGRRRDGRASGRRVIEQTVIEIEGGVTARSRGLEIYARFGPSHLETSATSMLLRAA